MPGMVGQHHRNLQLLGAKAQMETTNQQGLDMLKREVEKKKFSNSASTVLTLLFRYFIIGSNKRVFTYFGKLVL